MSSQDEMASTCFHCGRANAPAAAFCQFCGRALAAASRARADETAEAPARALVCPQCRTDNPAGTNFCFECGSRLQGVSAVPPAGTSRRARLVAVRRDGSDGAVYPFDRDQLDIGRSEGDLLFDDPHLAARHARILRLGGHFTLVPLELRNGVYVRITAPVPVTPGDYVLVGKQVLMFEQVPPLERSLPAGIEQGVVLFGTPLRPPWGRLRQMTAAGTARDVYHLSRNEVVLGREVGDIVFTGDEFMSRRHAILRNVSGHFELEDLASSNGTFLRLRSQHPLASGEMIRLGDELLRFELS